MMAGWATGQPAIQQPASSSQRRRISAGVAQTAAAVGATSPAADCSWTTKYRAWRSGDVMAAAVVVEALSPLLTPQRIQKLRIAAALSTCWYLPSCVCCSMLVSRVKCFSCLTLIFPWLGCSNTHFGFENVWKNDNTAAALRSVECAGVQNVHLVRGEAVHKKRVNHSLSKSAERGS